MNFVEYPDVEMMMMDLANKLASEIRQALQQDGIVSIAVPGGTTPGPIFDDLSAAELDWARVRIMLTDERWVPETSDRSNTRLLRNRLFQNYAAAATLVPLYADTETPEESLPALAAQVETVLPLTVALLGMGTDMHTASIFPGADQLHAALTGDDTLVAMRAPGAPEPRITLSAKVLKDAMNCHVVITGAEKRAALERARHLTSQEAPIAAILANATVHWAES